MKKGIVRMQCMLLLYDCAKKHWTNSDIKYIEEKQKFITDRLIWHIL
jgi:hypothetical protein